MNLLKNIFLVVILISVAGSIFPQNGRIIESDYTVPSWTLYCHAVMAGEENPERLLVPKDYPYNINTVFNGNPATRIGITWFTNAGITGGRVQLVEGKVAGETAFDSPLQDVMASGTALHDIYYNWKINLLERYAGIPDNQKRSYISNKIVLKGLKPNTTYSYRIGKERAWSAPGSFTTAKNNTDPYDFIYITDPQGYKAELFDITQRTVEAAYGKVPGAKFILVNGDFVDSYGKYNYEWEWEQWFERMQHIWLHLPIVPAQGNHDVSLNMNMFHHFNTDTAYNAIQVNEKAKTKMNGTVYSFPYGDVLFLVLNFEEYYKGEEYFEALGSWMEKEIESHPYLKWKIVACHRTVYTGSNHQDDADGKIIRENMVPVFDRLGIDVVIQGHDHIYEVIGVLKNGQLVENAVSGQQSGQPHSTTNVTGTGGGRYNVDNGTLYFLNNCAGYKKHIPKSEQLMEASYGEHGVENYFGMFGKLGQPGDPTFSHVAVSTGKLEFTTYTVDEYGEISQYDSFTVVKDRNEADVSQNIRINFYPNPAKDRVTIECSSKILNIGLYSINGQCMLLQKDNSLNVSNLANGVYLLKITSPEKVYSERLVIKK